MMNLRRTAGADWPAVEEAAVRTLRRNAIRSWETLGVLCLVAFAVAALPDQAVAQQGWTSDVRTVSAPALTGPGGPSVDVAAHPDGSATVVWTQTLGSVSVVQSARLPAGGDTWTAPVTTSSSSASCASIAGDAAGNAVATWHLFDGSHRRVQASRYVAATGAWTVPVDLSPGEAASCATVATDPHGNAIAMWALSISADEIAIQVSRLSAATGGWSAVTELLRAPGWLASFDLALDADGNAIAVLAANGVYWSRYVAATDSWTGPGLMPVIGGLGGGQPQVGVDPAGNAVAVWGQGGAVWAARYDRALASWLVPVLLASGGGAQTVAVDPAGDALAVWVREAGPQLTVVEAARYEIAAGRWSGTTVLSAEGLAYPQVAVAVDAAGNGVATWSRWTAGSCRCLRAARFAAATGAWTPTGDLSAPGQEARSPHVQFDPGGNARVVWLQQAGDMSAIQARSWRAAPMAPSPTGVEAGAGTLSLSFVPPPSTEPMFAPINYAYSLDDGVTWIPRTPASTASPLVIDGLVDGVPYDVRLRAMNGAGGGAASERVAVMGGSGSSAPSGLRVVAMEGQTVTLAWMPPASGLRPTTYLIEGGLTPGDVLARVDTGTAAPEATFQVPTGTFYARVVARSGGVRTPSSNEVRLVVDVPAAPSAPENLLALATGPLVTLSWTNTFSGGVPTSLRLHVTGAVTAVVNLPLGERFTASAVSPGTYTVTMTAVNTAGESPPSNAVTLTVPPPAPLYPCLGLPDAPTLFRAWQQDGVLSVSWSPPASGVALTGYTVLVSGDFFGSFRTTGRSLSGRVPAGAYWLSVAGTNLCGGGAATPPQRVVVP
jgi:hypothetical protein